MNLDGETIDALGYGDAFDPWRFAVLDVDLRHAAAARSRKSRKVCGPDATGTERKRRHRAAAPEHHRALDREAQRRRRAAMTDEQRRAENVRRAERKAASAARRAS